MTALRELVRTPAAAVSTAALVMTAAALSACGSAGAPGSGQATAGGQPTGAVAACAPSALRVTLDSSAAGVATGSSYIPLEFTNSSARACTLSGYPAVTLTAGAAGPQIGNAAAAEQATRSTTLTLAPGGVAHAWLQIADVANYPASRCRPVQAGGIRVAFAGTDTAAFLPHSLQACANAMPGSSVLAVFPVQAGQAKRGTAP